MDVFLSYSKVSNSSSRDAIIKLLNFFWVTPTPYRCVSVNVIAFNQKLILLVIVWLIKSVLFPPSYTNEVISIN